DRLDAEDAAHFAAVQELLARANIAFEVDPTLVRGLDYYTRTVFEFTSDALGSQSGVGGGGRYDGLVELLGGPPTPGIGWAAGIERILLAAEAPLAAAGAPVSLYVAADVDGQEEEKPIRRSAAFRIVTDARAAGLGAQLEL